MWALPVFTTEDPVCGLTDHPEDATRRPISSNYEQSARTFCLNPTPSLGACKLSQPMGIRSTDLVPRECKSVEGGLRTPEQKTARPNKNTHDAAWACQRHLLWEPFSIDCMSASMFAISKINRFLRAQKFGARVARCTALAEPSENVLALAERLRLAYYLNIEVILHSGSLSSHLLPFDLR